MRDYARARLMHILEAGAGAGRPSSSRRRRRRRQRPKHGLSAFGELKYPADFKHFEWVNPDAPKGGRLATIGTAALTTLRQLQQPSS